MSFVETKIHYRIFVVLSRESQVKRPIQNRSAECCFIGLSCDDSKSHTFIYSLEEMYKFDHRMQRFASRSFLNSKIIVCAGLEHHHQAEVLFLLGCHLAMSKGLGFEEILLAFRPFTELMARTSPEMSWVENYWRAICCAKCLNWIDFIEKSSDKNAFLQMDEYMHYAR